MYVEQMREQAAALDRRLNRLASVPAHVRQGEQKCLLFELQDVRNSLAALAGVVARHNAKFPEFRVSM
jgi:hypothetical protein